MAKKYFVNDLDRTPDLDCTLKPAFLLDGSAEQTEDYCREERRWQSAPSACRLDDGRILCVLHGDNFNANRTYSKDKGDFADGEGPNNYAIIYLSEDEGLSWKPITIIDHEDYVRVHEAIVWVDKNGTVYCFWNQSYRWWDNRAGVWMIKATPEKYGEILWSAPTRVCDGVIAQIPTETKDGRILLPVSMWKKYKSGYHEEPPELSDPCVYELKGDKAEYIGHAHIEDTDFDENSVVEREDGSLYMIARCLTAVRGSISKDGGKTWGEPFKIMRHMSSRSLVAKFPSGNLVLITNDHDTNRCNMTAFLSEDGGETWKYSLLLDERDAVSYPSGMVAKNGKCYFAYDHGRVTDREVFLACFDENDIRNGSLGKDSYIRLVCKAGR